VFRRPDNERLLMRDRETDDVSRDVVRAEVENDIRLSKAGGKFALGPQVENAITAS
jgi:hypothetical protein